MEILQWFESVRTPFFTQLFQIFTAMGEEMVIIAIICGIYWCYNKGTAYRIIFGVFLSAMFIQSLKIIYRIPRPWVRFKNLHPVGEVMGNATGYSFPSGHTNAATAFYGSTFFYSKKRWIHIASVIIILGVGISRMYLGMHTLTDVIVSFILTFLITWIVSLLVKRTWSNKSRVIGALLFAGIATIVLVNAVVLLNRGIILGEYAKDAITAACCGYALALGWYIESRFIQFDVAVKDSRLQILKYVLGIGAALIFKLLWEIAIPETIILDSLCYFLIISWAMIGYPLIIKKMFQCKEK